MRGRLWIIAGIILYMLASACSDSKEESYEINYRVCIGRQGTCPGAETRIHQINKDTGAASCRIVKEGDFYLLTFLARDLSPDSRGSLQVEELEFQYNEGLSSTGISCNRGGVTFKEGENEFKTTSCVTGEVGQGQCKVTVNVHYEDTLGDIVEGTIECNEIPINGTGDQYLSTLEEGSWHNTFTFINSCLIPDDML